MCNVGSVLYAGMSKNGMLSMTSRQVVLPPLAHHEQLSRDSMLSLLGIVAALVMQTRAQQPCCFHSNHRMKKLAAAHQ